MHALSETWKLKNSTSSSPICSVQPQKWATKGSHEGERQQYTQYTVYHCLPALVLSRMYTSTYRTAVLIHYSFENYYVFVLPGELSKWIGTAEKQMKTWFIIAVMHTTKAVVKLKLKKKTWMGFEPITSATPVQCSTNWAIKPTGSWSHCEFVIYP